MRNWSVSITAIGTFALVRRNNVLFPAPGNPATTTNARLSTVMSISAQRPAGSPGFPRRTRSPDSHPTPNPDTHLVVGRADPHRGRRAGLTLRLTLLIFAVPDSYNFTRGRDRPSGGGGLYGCAEYRDDCGERITEEQYLAGKERGMHRRCRKHRLPMTTKAG